MSNESNAKPLWNVEDEQDLKEILIRIYSSVTLENLTDVFSKGVACNPKYHDLFEVAMEEKKQQITNTPVSSFEIKESRTRKIWILSFCTYYFIYWLSFLFIMFFINSLLISFFLAALIAIPMCAVYHCAHEMKGTKLLLLVLIISPLVEIWFFVKEGINLSLWFFTAFDLAIFGFYWFSSLNLLRVNYKVKVRKQLDGLRELL